MTIYPHLSVLMETLTQGLQLHHPVMAYASLDQVTIQGTPSLFLIPEDLSIVQSIADLRTITSLRMRQEWLLITVLRDSSDQKVTTPLINRLGEFQARLLNLLMKDVLVKSGPLQIMDCPKSEPIEGGAIAGKIRISTQFVFNSE